jgi:hypothetical protein
MSATSYECPLHKTQHDGLQRQYFDRDVFDALLLANMSAAMRVYKEVKQGCHCPTNYAAFDRIIAEEDSLNDFRQQSIKDANKHTGAR